MTLSVAWIRQFGKIKELIVATDSRLRGGQAWDCCPKIVTLPRGDSVLCFAGATDYAYPFMLQMKSAIVMYEKSASRAMDLTKLRGHLIRLLEGMRDDIHDLPKNAAPVNPDVILMLAGYSWYLEDFRIWRLFYKPSEKAFIFRRASTHRKKTKGTKCFQFVGDDGGKAEQKLYDLLEKRNKLAVGYLDLEPFEVLRDMIRDPQFSTIGGPPQLVKVYRHMNTLPFNVFWPKKDAGKLSFLGRPLLPYERNNFLTIDPDTLETFNRKEVEEIILPAIPPDD